MATAVRFDSFGGPDVLYLADVDVREPEAGEVRVTVKAAGINPGESSIRSGKLEHRFHTDFPCGQGTDFAGIVDAVGSDASDIHVGDDVLGWSWERSSHATQVTVPAQQVTPKPAGLSWESAGALDVAGTTAYAAVRAIDASPGDVVAVSGAAGGVGTITVQLLRIKGATVIGIASENHHEWLRSKGVIPVAYGDGIAERIRDRAPDGVDAFIDLFGADYLDLAVELGVRPERIETIIAFDRAAEICAKAEGSSDAAEAAILGELAERAATGQIEVPIASAYPLEKVQDAFTELDARHTRGKIVLIF